MLSTFSSVCGQINLRCPLAGQILARDWVTNAFREVAEGRRWSWLMKQGQFLFPALYSTGTVSLTNNLTTVTGSGTTFTPAMVGRQFRCGGTNPIYTIASFISTTSLELDQAWGGTAQSGAGFEIYQAYVTVPSDFHAFVSVIDPNFSWQLTLNVGQDELNAIDAQRASTGTAWVVSAFPYATSQAGTVSSPLQVRGTGPSPLVNGSYSGGAAATFVIEITTGGAVATAEFKWKKDSGTYTTGVLSDPGPLDLQEGVQISFPAGTYVSGDVWTVDVSPGMAGGLPRYELWPHQTSQYVYPFLYESRATDLGDAGASLPRFIRGDMLMEMALANCARWPGPSMERPNPYFSLSLANQHDARAKEMMEQAERQDDEVWMQDVRYMRWSSMPNAPFVGANSSYWQSHAM